MHLIKRKVKTSGLKIGRVRFRRRRQQVGLHPLHCDVEYFDCNGWKLRTIYFIFRSLTISWLLLANFTNQLYMYIVCQTATLLLLELRVFSTWTNQLDFSWKKNLVKHQNLHEFFIYFQNIEHYKYLICLHEIIINQKSMYT